MGVPAAHVTDGLSNSVIFAEKLSNPSIAAQQTVVWEELPHLINRAFRVVEVDNSDPEDVRKACLSAPPLYERLWWFDSQYTHLMNINEPSVVNVSSGKSFIRRGQSAASLHVGGAHIGLADGSGRFVSDQIDLKTWRGLGTIAGGEVISEY